MSFSPFGEDEACSLEASFSGRLVKVLICWLAIAISLPEGLVLFLTLFECLSVLHQHFTDIYQDLCKVLSQLFQQFLINPVILENRNGLN